MINITHAIDELARILTTYTTFSLYILAALWFIHCLNFCCGYAFNWLGIIPRRLYGLIGIPLAPLLHGNFNHLLFNSVPLYALIIMCMINGVNQFIAITVSITLISGFLIWLFARRGIHLGASALIMGYFAYLMIHAYLSPSAMSIVLVLVSVYYFGGLIASLLPGEASVSWEGHVFGFVAGLISFISVPYIIPIVDQVLSTHFSS